jgi:hypothetical protein
MKLLLDENVPRQLKRDITEHEVFTVREKEWNGKLNGELLKLMLADQFDGFITADKNLKHQQNFEEYPIPVIVLSAYRITYEYFKPLVPKLKEVLRADLPNGPTIIK